MPVPESANQRNCELVGYFQAEGAGLSEANMMRLRRAPAADEARFTGDESKMCLIANFVSP